MGLPSPFIHSPTRGSLSWEHGGGLEDVGGGGGSGGGTHCNNDRISNPLESLSPRGEQSGYMLKLSAAKRRLFFSFQ